MELRFVENNTLEEYVDAMKAVVDAGARRITIRGFTPLARAVVERATPFLSAAGVTLTGFDHAGSEPPAGVIPFAAGEGDAESECGFIFVMNDLPSVMAEYLEAPPHFTLVAPMTPRFWKRRNIYINSVFKGGTHLLLELLKLFGFRHTYTPVHDDIMTGYAMQLHGHSHIPSAYIRYPFLDETELRRYFLKETVFIYRDPRAVALSLAHFIPRASTHPLWAYYRKIRDVNARLTEVIKGPPVPYFTYTAPNGRPAAWIESGGNLRDFMMGYAGWLDMNGKNTVAMRFEDLVGPKGGGDAQAQRRLIWRLQLALMVPGKTEIFANNVYNPNTPTFRKGGVDSFREEFQKEHYDALQRLPQDFMEIFGYR